MAALNKTSAQVNNTPVKDKLFFEFLPDFAIFIRDNHLEEYTRDGLKYSREEDVPVLRLLTQFTDEQLFEMGMKSGYDFLTVIAENKCTEYLETATANYVKNQIPLLESQQIVAEDITSISFVRRKVWRKYLRMYTQDFDLFCNVMGDADRYFSESEIRSFNAYLQVQQEKINLINTRLAQSESQLLEAQDLTDMGSFLWHFNGSGKSSFTPGLMKIFEMEQTSNLESFFENVHEDDRAKLKEAIDKSFAEDGIYECEYRFVKNNIEKKIWSKGKVTFQDGKPQYMTGTVMDVTQKNNLLEKLQHNKTELETKAVELESLNNSLEFKNIELERVNKELESFNYIASHDLQEPLRKIQLFTNRIIENGGNMLIPSAKEYLDKIGSSSARMKLLIEDLLTFSQSIIKEDNIEPTNLNLILDEVKTILSAVIEEKKVVIESDVLPVLPVVPFQIQQVLLNLIVNAIKYTAEGVTPHIRISSDIVSGKNLKLPGVIPTKNYSEIKIEDNGIGFDEKHAESIFKLFHRLHRKDEYSGTGIGLAICKKIIQNHKGFIIAKSNPGVGSAFYIYLPYDHVPQKKYDV